MYPTAQVINLEERRDPVVKADLDDGYYRLANAIAEMDCRLKLGEVPGQVYAAVKLKTFGWNKSEDWISNSQLADLCELSPSRVSEGLKVLIQRNIVFRDGKKIGINTVVSQWELSSKAHQAASKKTPPKRAKELRHDVKEEVTPQRNEISATAELELRHDVTVSSAAADTQQTVNTPTTNTITTNTHPVLSQTDLAKQILDHLNKKTGKKFRPVKSNLDLIKARLNEDYSTDDLTTLINNMVFKWAKDPKMAQYLRPSTLFQAGKADGYLNDTPQIITDFTPPTTPVGQLSAAQERRAKVTNNVMDINNTDW